MSVLFPRPGSSSYRSKETERSQVCTRFKGRIHKYYMTTFQLSLCSFIPACLAILFHQNTVPSLSISIGGPPVAGRFCFAITRPPFQVALSSTCASVSCSVVKPSCFRISTAIRSLSREFVLSRVSDGRRAEGENVQFNDSHGPPFYDGRVRREKLRDLCVGVGICRRIEHPGAQREDSKVDQQATCGP